MAFEEQAKTLENIEAILDEWGKGVILRPTGFGKTWLLTSLISKYGKVLYIYPAQVIKDTVIDRYYDSLDSDMENEDANIDPETLDLLNTLRDSGEIQNCDLMTYNKLARSTKEELAETQYDLIIFDECHRLGGFATKIATETLMTVQEHAKFVGATATPTRMDNFDVVSYFFDDHMTYSYTLYDAIEDGLLQKPHYCFCTVNAEKDIKDAAKEAGENLNDSDTIKVLNKQIIEAAKLNNLPYIIKTVNKECKIKTDYMKFVVFFTSRQHMSNKIGEVEEWFREAYPKHKINTLRISYNTDERDNVNNLSTLVPKKKTIDLIACIDMINMGYHVNNLTGIIMYRLTKSSIIYIQQLGRALSAGNNNASVVFDIVDNLHTRAVYNIAKRKPNKHKASSSRLGDFSGEASASNNEKNRHNVLTVNPDDNKVYRTNIDNDGTVTQKETPWHRADDSNDILDIHGNKTNKVLLDNGIVIDRTSPENEEIKNNVNNFDKRCFDMVGYMATYREFIAKAVAEPMTQRCKYALELHFRSWCMQHGVPYPITDEELTNLYNLDKEDFYKEFVKIVKANKIQYNLLDAQALLQMGVDNDDIPLDICAKARNTSIETILNTFNIPYEERKAI